MSIVLSSERNAETLGVTDFEISRANWRSTVGAAEADAVIVRKNKPTRDRVMVGVVATDIVRPIDFMTVMDGVTVFAMVRKKEPSLVIATVGATLFATVRIDDLIVVWLGVTVVAMVRKNEPILAIVCVGVEDASRDFR